MARRKKIMILPTLKDCKGDITKQWFIEYSYRDPKTDKMNRKRQYIPAGLNEIQRRKEGIRIIEEITAQLESGWTPETPDKTIYEDHLEYSNIAKVYGNKKASNNTIRKICNQYLELKNLEINKKSYVCYQSKYRVICQYFDKNGYGEIDVSAISREMIIKFLKQIALDRKLAVRSVAKYQQTLYSLFNYMLRDLRIIKENPIYDIPRIGTIKDEAPLPFSEDDRELLARTISSENPWLWLACQLMYYTALRPGEEIRLLKISQINFSAKTITVFATTAKNTKRETIDLPDQLYKQLIEVYQLQNFDKSFYVFGKNGIPGDKPLGVNTMYNRFVAIRNRLKISSDYTFYSWKHTGASALTTINVSPYELQKHLRHTSLSTTEHYIRNRIGQKSEKIKHKFPDISKKE